MDISITLRHVAHLLSVAGFICLGTACGHSRTREVVPTPTTSATAVGGTPSSQQNIDEATAVRFAVNFEERQRGRKLDSHRYRATAHRVTGGWTIYIHGLPAIPGGYTHYTVSDSGEVTPSQLGGR